MKPNQYNTFIQLFKILNKQHGLKDYNSKLTKLNHLKIQENGNYNFKEISTILEDKRVILTLLNALEKEEGCKLVKIDLQGEIIWDDSQTRSELQSVKGSKFLNEEHPSIVVGSYEQKSLLIASCTTKDGQSMNGHIDGIKIGEPLNILKYQKLLQTDPKIYYYRDKLYKQWNNQRPISTAIFGENGNLKTILIGYNYDSNTKEFTAQYIGAVLLMQYYNDLKSNLIDNTDEKPADLIKLAALLYIYKNRETFKIYNSKNNSFENLKSDEFVPFLPQKYPDWKQHAMGIPSENYHIKVEKNEFTELSNDDFPSSPL